MVNYIVCSSLNEVSYFKNDAETFSDIETSGLYIDTRLVQVYQPSTDENVYILDTDKIDLEEIKLWLLDKWTIWQGCTYDFGCLHITTREFDDTLMLARIAYPELGEFTLDNLASAFGADHLYDGLNKKELQKLGFKKGAYLSQVQLKYSAADVVALSIIWKDKGIQEAKKVLAYQINKLSIKYAVQYQQNKLVVHQPSVMKELIEVETKIAEWHDKLHGINPNSPKQCKEALGAASTDKNTLIKLIADGNQLAEAIFTQRRLIKRQGFLRSYNYPWVETRFNPAGAATGRFTSTGGDLDRGINAQQITRDLQYIFHQPTDTTSVVHADFSTAELRAGCSIMKDETMYNELKAGNDLHKIAATLAMPDKQPHEVTKAERQKGKAISFGFIFGMSAESFQEYAYVNYGVKFTLEECKMIKQNYARRYQGISAYHRQMWNSYKTTPVSTPAGTRNMPRLGTDAINFATQGGIAEVTKLSVHYLCKEFPEAVMYIFNVVHDAIYLRVPKGDEQLWADRLAIAMKKGWEEFCKLPMMFYKDIPMPVEIEWVDPETNNHVVKEY